MSDYPDDFDHPDFQAWLQEREGQLLEREALDKMESEYKYPWQPNQNKPSTNGLKTTSTGSSKESKPQQRQAFRTYGRVIKAIASGLKLKL